MTTPQIIARRAALPVGLRPVGGFDVDDIAHDFVGRCYAKIGLPYERHTNFCVEDISHFSKEQHRMILDAFSDAEIFREMQFYPGFEDIMKPAEDFGIREIFATSCTSDQNAAHKRANIHAKIIIPDSDILTFVNGPAGKKSIKKKALPDNMLFYVDDGLHNLASSTAEYLISMNKPWNTDREQRKQHLGDKKVYWFDDGDLRSINEFIYEISRDRVLQLLS